MSAVARPDGSKDPVSSASSGTPISHVASKFLGSIAHDLRTPIMVIRGYMKMMLDGRTGPVTEDQAQCLKVMIASVQRLSEIADATARGSESITGLRAEYIPVVDLWRMACDSVPEEVATRAAALKEQSPESDLIVCGDRQMLSSAVAEMMVFAFDLTDANSESQVEFSKNSSKDVVIALHVGSESTPSNTEGMVSRLQASVFLIGGRFSLDTKVKSRLSFRLVLPGREE